MANHGKGGRPKGARSAKSKKTDEIISRFVASGETTPLEIMLSVMKQAWEAGEPMTAVAVAEKAAPYVHPRLAATTVSGNPNAPLTVQFIDNIK